MKSSNGGGGRKRGRPVTLTPEQRLEREKERWRRKKAARRKRDVDAQWERKTNFGYFAKLWVMHPYDLAETLVADGCLHEDDVDIPPRVDAAVDEYFTRAIDLQFNESGSRSRKLRRSEPGIVRVRMTQDLADKLAAVEQGVKRGWRYPDPIVSAEMGEIRAQIVEARLRGRINEMRAMEAQLEELADRVFVARNPDAVEPITCRKTLERIAERCLYGFYSDYVFNPPEHPCNCKLALPVCDCISRFGIAPGPGALGAPPKMKRPRAGKVLAKRTLYSERMPRWWTSQKPCNEDDPIVRSHAQLVEEPKKKKGAEDNDYGDKDY